MKEWLKMSSDCENFLKNKDDFRLFCRKKLLKSAEKKRLKLNYLALQNLKKVLKNLNFRTILLYLPLSFEANFRKEFRNLRRKYILLVPFMQGVSFKVVKYRLPIFKKKFSIYEPKNSNINFSVDVMIVPVIGVDGDFKRIGFGKGMYDRYFQSLTKKPLVIFVQLDECCTKFVVSEAHDIQADIYLTPKKIIYKRGFHGTRNKFNRSDSDLKRRGRIFYS